ncbi:MAG: dihydrofolate reductase [Alphaproteobacteria bacterium]
MKPIISLIVAASQNGVIGKDGALPWRIREDMARFKRLTMGHPCIMGRKTWDSIPKKPLPGRTNIVVTRNDALTAEGALVASSFEAALEFAMEENPTEIMIIGGAAIYAEALARAGRIYFTEVAGHIEGDAFFPQANPHEWRQVLTEGPFEEEAHRYRYLTLERA